MRRATLLVGLGLFAAGCQCQPDIPPPPDTDTDTEDTTTATGTTGDTGPTPPCPVPEVEPNNSVLEPTPLVMEKRACGQISAPLDLDYWEFTLEADAWLEVAVEKGNGAIADMTFVLTPTFDNWAASREDDRESTDATVRFPAPAGTYQLVASDQNFGGGDRYDYDLLVTEAKAPVEYTTSEAEPNDSLAAAAPIAGGERVWGTLDGNGALPDYDWYVLTVPAGKHTVSIDVDAFDFGSSANVTVYLYSPSLTQLPAGCVDGCPPQQVSCVECALEGGIDGVELDPIGEYDSSGSELVYIQVLEASGLEGPAAWYVLDIGLEGT